MHGSLWIWRGDPDELAARYEAMLADIPSENMQFSVCTKLPDGIAMIDTCPSKEVFEAFSSSPELQGLLAAHGLGAPDSVVDGSVIAAWSGGERVDD